MSLNVSLNEKMLNIHDNLNNAIQRGFSVMEDKNAVIPDIKNLESLIETVERFPNISPIPDRYYQWKECEFFDIDPVSGLIPDTILSVDVQGMAKIDNKTYVFLPEKTFFSSDGYNFGIDPTGFTVLNDVGEFDLCAEHQYVVINSSFSHLGLDNPFVYLSNREEEHSIYIHFSHNTTRETYKLLDCDYRLLGLHIYTSKEDASKYLMIISTNEIYTIRINDMCQSLYATYIENTETPIECITRIMDGEISAYTLLNDHTIAAAIITNSDAEETNIQIMSFTGNTGFERYDSSTTARTSFLPHTLVYVNNDSLYAISYEKVSTYHLNLTEFLNDKWVFETDDYKEYVLMARAGMDEYVTLDLINSVIRHHNYLIFITSDAIYFTTAIHITLEGHAIIFDTRVAIPYYLGTYSHIWILEDTMYMQGLTGEIYGLRLPEYMGTPELASKAGMIANGITGDITRGALGQMVAGTDWKHLYDYTDYPSAYTVNTFQFAEVGPLMLLCRHMSTTDIDVRAIIGDENIDVLSLIKTGYRFGIHATKTVKDDTIEYTKVFLVGDGQCAYLIIYDAAKPFLGIYKCDGDAYSWGTYYETTIASPQMIEIISNAETIQSSEGMGYIVKMNASSANKIAILGPNLEIPENPYNFLASELASSTDYSLGYEDGFFYVRDITGNMIYKFKLKWDINILGDLRVTIEYRKNISTQVASELAVPFLNGIIEVNHALGGILFTPYDGFEYTLNSPTTIMSYRLNTGDATTSKLYRLINCVLYFEITSHENEYENYKAIVTYDGINWHEIVSPAFHNTLGTATNPLDYHAVHGKHIDLLLFENRLYMSGSYENAFQQYIRISKVLSLREGQFHHHFTFSPANLFFEVINETDQSKFVGCWRRTHANTLTEEEGNVKAFGVSAAYITVDETGETMEKFYLHNRDFLAISLNGQDFNLVLPEDVYKAEDEYRVTLYAFK